MALLEERPRAVHLSLEPLIRGKVGETTSGAASTNGDWCGTICKYARSVSSYNGGVLNVTGLCEQRDLPYLHRQIPNSGVLIGRRSVLAWQLNLMDGLIQQVCRLSVARAHVRFLSGHACFFAVRRQRSGRRHEEHAGGVARTVDVGPIAAAQLS